VLGSRLLGTWPLSPRNVDRSLLGELSRTSGWFAVYNIAKLAVERVDAVVVGVVVGAAQAATYAVGQKLASFASRIVFPISAALFPHAAELEGRGSTHGLRDTVRLGTRISLGIAGPVCVTAALLARPTLHVWLGPGFAGAAPVVVYLLAAVSISALVYTASLVTQGRGDARTPSLAYLAEGAINLVLSVLLGRALGFTGVALATLIATAAVQLLWFYPFLCRKLGMPLGRTVSGLLVPHLLPAAAAVVVGFVVRGPADDGVVQLLIAGALTAGTYVALLALTGLGPEERRAVIDRLRRARAGTGTTA
jgi:O-antigen/teichoic acid export membrane protein